MIRAAAVASLFLFMALPLRAQGLPTSLDDTPIAWGETDERDTTVCAKRWHALKVRDVRTLAIAEGMGADEQVRRESQAVLKGQADCVTARVRYRPLDHADVILGADTWVLLLDPDGPVICHGTKHCRWAVQRQNFVEAEAEIAGRKAGTVYVATPRPVQPARIGGPPPMDGDPVKDGGKPAAASR